MQYWKNLDDNQVYGFDISDPSQVAARDQLISTGSWEDITGNWPLPPPAPTAEQNKITASNLLQQTDWVMLSDVDNPALTPHLLNKSEFVTYRSNLRSIAVNPVAGNINWPTKPVEQWSE